MQWLGRTPSSSPKTSWNAASFQVAFGPFLRAVGRILHLQRAAVRPTRRFEHSGAAAASAAAAAAGEPELFVRSGIAKQSRKKKRQVLSQFFLKSTCLSTLLAEKLLKYRDFVDFRVTVFKFKKEKQLPAGAQK